MKDYTIKSWTFAGFGYGPRIADYAGVFVPAADMPFFIQALLKSGMMWQSIQL
ncbi:MAG: hypothetical protein LBS19_03800 [Clostridiales bacterium]|jgi:hypothetical protein|nr:hypothetical protein [Clostridiales bacterium]